MKTFKDIKKRPKLRQLLRDFEIASNGWHMEVHEGLGRIAYKKIYNKAKHNLAKYLISNF